MTLFCFLSQNPAAELAINPDVDEEVGEVVDGQYVVEVARDGRSSDGGVQRRSEGACSQNEETRADLHCLRVC